MRIVAFGSSHTVGFKLNDVKDSHYDTISNFAFPNIVAEHFNCPVVNYGKCANPIDQIYTDVLAYLPYQQPDDIIILQLTKWTHWFKLITPDNHVYNINNPDSLKDKGAAYTGALEGLMGTLTGDSHWVRTWYLNFFSIMNVLFQHNRKFVFFFDSYSVEYLEFDTRVNILPDGLSHQMRDIKKSMPDPSQYYLEEIFSLYLEKECPGSIIEGGHYNEIGHKFWAEQVLIPAIKTRLT